MEDPEKDPKGSDTTAYLYVLGGIPFLILFFIILFGVIVGGCDGNNVMIHV